MNVDIEILKHHIDRQKCLAAANVGEERREAQSLLYILQEVRKHIKATTDMFSVQH